MATATTAPRRPTRTYWWDGRETYVDTGRPVDETLGSHVVLWIVDDPQAWAAAVEAEGDVELTRWPKKDRALAEEWRAEHYQSAAQIRERGPHRSVRTHYHDGEQAAVSVADLYRSHPNPGVRYEAAEITGYSACPDCHQPTIEAGGQWWHHLGRYPAECAKRPGPAPTDSPPTDI